MISIHTLLPSYPTLISHSQLITFIVRVYGISVPRRRFRPLVHVAFLNSLSRLARPVQLAYTIPSTDRLQLIHRHRSTSLASLSCSGARCDAHLNIWWSLHRILCVVASSSHHRRLVAFDRRSRPRLTRRLDCIHSLQVDRRSHRHRRAH